MLIYYGDLCNHMNIGTFAFASCMQRDGRPVTDIQPEDVAPKTSPPTGYAGAG
jgi:hypothetical protein